MDVALAVFGAQSKSPGTTYLDSIRSFILNHNILRCIVDEIHTLDDVWNILKQHRPSVAELTNVPRYTSALSDWILHGQSSEVATIFSGIVTLPRLAIIQLAQYFSFLSENGLEHEEFIARTGGLGGIQGFCGGLPAAIAVASATDEEALKRSVCTAIRLSYAIGIYAELGDDSEVPGVSTLVVRLKYEGQAEELVAGLPGVYISAMTDPRSVSIVGPVDQLAVLQETLQEKGLLSQSMDIRGKTHNPENSQLGEDLSELCQKHDSLDMGDSSQLKSRVRSNKVGVRELSGSLTREIVTTILCDRCEWYAVLTAAAADIRTAGASEVSIACFGIGDCTSLMPFHKEGLIATKQQWTAVAGIGSKDTSDSIDTQYPDQAIAVVGASCRLPGANNLDEYWQLISGGRDMHQEVPTDRFNLHDSYRASLSGDYVRKRKFYGNFVDRVNRFDHEFFGINAREAVNMDPQQRMLLELAYEAVESSGYMRDHERSRGDNIGCFIGASFVEYLDNTNAHAPTAYTSTGTIRAFLCGRLSWFFGWTGPAEVIDTACSSSLVAVNRAVRAIQTGECSGALVGGVNIITGIQNYMDLGKAGFLSPTGQCKPFDESGDGYCRSEGGALIFIKPYSKAQTDGDNILAVLPATGTNQGGLSCALTVPDSDSLADLYRSVLKNGDLQPDAVSYVEAHGTGTQAGDPVEIASIRKVFGHPNRRSTLHVGSIKGNIGHTETCAGIAGLVKVICMLRNRRIPPQASHKRWNPKIPPLASDKMAISLQSQQWTEPLLAALVNSYGAAGSNAAALCCEAAQPGGGAQVPLASSKADYTYPIIVSAKTKGSLRAYRVSLAQYLRQASPTPHISKLAYVLCHQRRQYKCVTVFENVKDTQDLIDRLEKPDPDSNPLESPGKTVLLFSGQSKQIVGLAREIYDRHEAFRSKIDACDAILQDQGHPSILPAIFELDNLEDIVPLQTGLVSVQYAMAMCWIEAGVKVSAIVGHSLGELAALAVSGVLSLTDCLKLVATRAALIKSHWGHDHGSMMAVAATQQAIQEIIDSLALPVDIACFNAKTGQVVAGPTAAVESLETHLRGMAVPIKTKRVNTSHAFHSRLMDPVTEELSKVATTLEWKQPIHPIYFCAADKELQGTQYSPSSHARQPVFFEDAVKLVEQDLGRSAWIEVGVDSPVIAMAKQVVDPTMGHSFHSLSTTAKGGLRFDDVLAQTVCGLWRRGVDVSYWQFLGVSKALGAVWVPPYQFEDKTMWLENVDHAASLQRQLTDAPERRLSATSIPDRKPRLVVALENNTTHGSQPSFQISPESERFRTVVAGHAVRNRPLCPASVYMECVAMAVGLLNEGKEEPLEFSKLDMQAPLGVASNDMQVSLVPQSEGAWQFSISSASSDTTKKRVIHGHGSVNLNNAAESKLAVAVRFVQRRMKELQQSDAGEKLLGKRAYGLFSRVVTYADFLKGISSIELYESEAVATVDVRPNQPAQDESSAISMWDAVAIDNFIQVVGLLINTSDLVGPKEVMVCTAIESCTTTGSWDLAKSATWTVYASFSSVTSSQAAGDIFVFDPDESLAAAFTGCRFTKLDMTRLERALDSAGGQTPAITAQDVTSPNQQRRASQHPVPSSNPNINGVSETSASSTTSSSSVSKSDSSISDTLLKLLERYTGALPSSVSDETTLTDLGLDSLASVEFAGEIGASWNVELDPTELLEMTVSQLTKRLSSSSAATELTSVSDDSNNTDRSPPGTEDTKATQLDTEDTKETVLNLVAEMTGASQEGIRRDSTLGEIGVDSLAMVELAAGLPGRGPQAVDDGVITLDSTIAEVLKAVGGSPSSTHDPPQSSATPPRPTPVSRMETEPSPMTTPREADTTALQSRGPDLMAAMALCEKALPSTSIQHGFSNYWAGVAPKQDELVLAYIKEAFSYSGIDLERLRTGDIVPDLPHAARHSRLVKRLWEILEQHGIVTTQNGRHILCEGATKMKKTSATIHQELVQSHERYSVECRLMELTAPVLAKCLTGETDAAKLLFGTEKAAKTLESYYAHSPVLATTTAQLVTLIVAAVQDIDKTNARVIRILEVGAGTGGTTGALLEKIAQSNVRVQYTFTDISPSLVSKAKRKFAKYADWLDFTRLDLEAAIPQNLAGKFDIVLGTNCVHATTDRTMVCSRIRDLLSPKGFMVLSEITRVIDWYDLVFGLLDGWWLDKSYPLQPAENWMKVLANSGFCSTMYSVGPSEDLNTQQLLVGSKTTLTGVKGGPTVRSAPEIRREVGRASPILRKETMIYKTVAGVDIEADVYLPDQTWPKRMPVAVLLHGGGHMTLSRQAVRPWQISLLLSRGILPVSFDYRLAPEINIIDGAMNDVRDAVTWARFELVHIMSDRGIMVDTEKVVVIGWSSGGHLAMSTAWTLGAAGLAPPTAILSFYAPINFLGDDLFPRNKVSIKGKLSHAQLLHSELAEKPLTNYTIAGGEAPDLGWVKSGHPRSECLLSLFRGGRESLNFGLALMLNGRLGAHRTIGDVVAMEPTHERRATACPTAKLKAGMYQTPTHIIHGDADDIAPFSSGLAFYEEMARQGIKAGFTAIENGRHIHDLWLKPGSPEWTRTVEPGYSFLFDALDM